MRAAARPADRAGALADRVSATGMKLATGPRTATPTAFYQKRVPKGAPDYLETVEITFPSGRTAEEICPTEIAVPVWCAQMGTLTFHPWPVRRADVDHPDELRIDLDPQPGTTFADAVRVAGVAARAARRARHRRLSRRPPATAGVHIYVRIEPRWEFVDVRHAAIGFGRELERRDDRRHHRVVEGGAGRADLRRLQPEQPRPHHRLGVLAAAACRAPRSRRR